MQRFHDLPGVAAGQIGAADTAGKERIAGNEQALRLRVEAAGALRVAGSKNHPQRKARQPHHLSVGQFAVWRMHLGRLQSHPSSLRIHAVQEIKIGRMQQHRRAGQLAQSGRRAGVVQMRMGEQDLLEGQPQIGQPLRDAPSLVTRIDDNRLAALLIAHQRAIGLQRAGRKAFQDHGSIVWLGLL